MKRIVQIIAGVAAAGIIFTCSAADQDRSVADPEHSPTVHSQKSISPHYFARPHKASDLLGKDINNTHKEKIGEVADLLLDVESGRVALVVVSAGGILGVASHTTAVPTRLLTFDPSTKGLKLDASDAVFESAPEVDVSVWVDPLPSDQLRIIYDHFGQKPYGTGQSTTVSRPGPMQLASTISGKAVTNPIGDRIGSVNNLIIDLPAGRIVYLVVSSGGFLGLGDALNAVPPGKFRYSQDDNSLQANLTKEQLLKAPHFNSADWPDFSDRVYSSSVYEAYGVDPYFATDADNTARNKRDREEKRLTPLDHGNGTADIIITRRIRKAIMETGNFSVNAQNVKIITVNGRVTLRGPVNNKSEMETIFKIAQAVVPNGIIDNQIEVKQEK